MDSKVFDCNINSNRGLMQLFTGNKAEGTIYYDLMNFHNIGISSMDTFIKSRILQESSVTVPVRKHVLKTFTLPIHKQKIKKYSNKVSPQNVFRPCAMKTHFKSSAKEVQILFDRPGALSQDGSPTQKDLERCRRDDKKKPVETVENIVIHHNCQKENGLVL
ncbi:unnamed protein product [Mytilus coruscus]|uniref:Uncharacterized protein n=1 Tax=Mytilus coruscus TaxID=42192 RepID=A0A6J8E3K7_MYTCO|nr:unnamed protein product [Mytilus coruscus]